MKFFYHSRIESFRKESSSSILGKLSDASHFADSLEQKGAWKSQVDLLKNALTGIEGEIYFEYSIPRMGKRIDVLLVLQNLVFVVEFKVGSAQQNRADYEQVFDYALDLKNFHEPSHSASIIPVLIPTFFQSIEFDLRETYRCDGLYFPVACGPQELSLLIHKAIQIINGNPIHPATFKTGAYKPTPTIIEAALSLYNGHTVKDITRSDAGAKNLTETTEIVSCLIDQAQKNKEKIICFVTGVPGAGKTLVGLKVSIEHLDQTKGQSSVYLSGNGPLVRILQEALVRDKVANEKLNNRKVTKKEVASSVKTFIQNIHHYRDQYVDNEDEIPFDHVAIFDEAQRAWDKENASKFMRQKRGKPNFNMSEPEFLISVLDRHTDWAVVVCLVGGGQEINTGEAGISEWLKACLQSFPNWKVHLSPQLENESPQTKNAIDELKALANVEPHSSLHLSVSMRSFRAENLSSFVKYLLDENLELSREFYNEISVQYPLVMTRSIDKAKHWLREMARGSERYGIVVSSQAYRLKPFAIDIRSQIDPIHWFLNGRDDVRSSYFLEDVATEFQVQGLELDWVAVAWDADLRKLNSGWDSYSFKGTKWQRILKEERKQYLINAYRVLLTRARQGMVIIIPEGNPEDPSRLPKFYDGTYRYLKNIGLKEI